MDPEPPARPEVAPVALVFCLFLGVHLDTVKFPVIVPLSFLQATPDAAPAGDAIPIATKDTGTEIVATETATRNKRLM